MEISIVRGKFGRNWFQSVVISGQGTGTSEGLVTGAYC